MTDQAAWHEPRARAQAMLSAEELLAGLVDSDWRCRHEVVDRLVARWRRDSRTVPALLDALANDPVWQVREAVAMGLTGFDPVDVVDALHEAESDQHADVRWSARYSLTQLGLPVTHRSVGDGVEVVANDETRAAGEAGRRGIVLHVRQYADGSIKYALGHMADGGMGGLYPHEWLTGTGVTKTGLVIDSRVRPGRSTRVTPEGEITGEETYVILEEVVEGGSVT